jgi:hypothetical protein
MSSTSNSKKSWLRRNKLHFLVGVPLLSFILSPFPFGCGMIYSIEDNLRGHPEGPHGTQPPTFVGLWIRDELVPYDFFGQAFFLMSDGQLAGISGMTSRRWHFDNSSLFVDSISHCGNCYQGNVTSEYTTNFVGADQMLITNRNKLAKRGIAGTYRRFKITAALKLKMSQLSSSKNDDESFNARFVLEVIEQFDNLSNRKR